MRGDIKGICCWLCCHSSTRSRGPDAHLHLPLSHLPHSLSQLLTKLVGQTMMTLLAMGLPPSAVDPCCSSVHMRVMPCRVLPRPMSSAKMQPVNTIQHQQQEQRVSRQPASISKNILMCEHCNAAQPSCLTWLLIQQLSWQCRSKQGAMQHPGKCCWLQASC